MGCFLIVIVVGLLIGGGQGVYTAIKNPKPVTLSLAEYEKQRPDAEWVELTDCSLNLLDASVSKTFGVSISEVFIPLRPVGSTDEKAAVHVLLSTKDSKVIDALKSMEKASEKDALVKMIESRETLFQERTVRGLIRFGIEMKSKERNKLQRLDDRLVDNFVVIEEGGSPSLWPSLVMLVTGLGFVGFLLLGLLASAAPEATTTVEPPPLP